MNFNIFIFYITIFISIQIKKSLQTFFFFFFFTFSPRSSLHSVIEITTCIATRCATQRGIVAQVVGEALAMHHVACLSVELGGT